MLHLVLKINEGKIAETFKVIFSEGVLVHHDDLQRFSSMYDLECKGLVPHRLKSALFEVRFNPLIFDLENDVGVRGSIDI